jgi:hypothetical protein
LVGGVGFAELSNPLLLLLLDGGGDGVAMNNEEDEKVTFDVVLRFDIIRQKGKGTCACLCVQTQEKKKKRHVKYKSIESKKDK